MLLEELATTATDGFDGSWGDDDDIENTAPVYRVRKGETVRVTKRNDKTVYETVIRGWAHVTRSAQSTTARRASLPAPVTPT